MARRRKVAIDMARPLEGRLGTDPTDGGAPLRTIQPAPRARFWHGGPPPKYQPHFSEAEVAEARVWARSQAVPHGEVQRARLVLLLHEHPDLHSPEAARRLGQTPRGSASGGVAGWSLAPCGHVRTDDDREWTDRAITVMAVSGVTALTALGWALSYAALCQLELSAGMPTWAATLWPPCVDLLCSSPRWPRSRAAAMAGPPRTRGRSRCSTRPVRRRQRRGRRPRPP